MVLLKNDGNLLPLDKGKIHSIAVIGPDAYPAQPDGGGSAEAKPFTPVSYLEGIANYLGSSAKVYYEPGLPTFDEIAKHTDFTTEASGGQPGLKTGILHQRYSKRHPSRHPYRQTCQLRTGSRR